METIASAEIHNRLNQENRERWSKKPLLREIYAAFYKEIAGRIKHNCDGLIVELGSGSGNIRPFVPDCITTDIFPDPCLDRVENAYRMGFGDGTISNLILFDVWHHLQYPGTALNEFKRVLARGGRLIIFEPAMGYFARVVYGLFHEEPLGFGKTIEWKAPADFVPERSGYFAAQSYASRIFTTDRYADKLSGWTIEDVRYWSGLAYLASGGFKGRQLYPRSALSVVRKIDSLLSIFPRIFASRMLVVLEKAH